MQEDIEIWRMDKVSEKVGLAPSTIHAEVARKNFPPPFKLIPGGRAAGWLSTTIINHIEQRAEAEVENEK